MSLQHFNARIVQGHRVASGMNGNPRFPGGTLRMQAPFFKALGFDISGLYPGTLNVSIAPFSYQVVRPAYTFAKVKWHQTEPAEDFSFFDVSVSAANGTQVDGFVYFPHPDTKPAHFQKPDVLELLLPFIPSISYDAVLQLRIPAEQMRIMPPAGSARETRCGSTEGIKPA